MLTHSYQFHQSNYTTCATPLFSWMETFNFARLPKPGIFFTSKYNGDSTQYSTLRLALKDYLFSFYSAHPFEETLLRCRLSNKDATLTPSNIASIKLSDTEVTVFKSLDLCLRAAILSAFTPQMRTNLENDATTSPLLDISGAFIMHHLKTSYFVRCEENALLAAHNKLQNFSFSNEPSDDVLATELALFRNLIFGLDQLGHHLPEPLAAAQLITSMPNTGLWVQLKSSYAVMQPSLMEMFVGIPSFFTRMRTTVKGTKPGPGRVPRHCRRC
jgi:hypothetical protein